MERKLTAILCTDVHGSSRPIEGPHASVSSLPKMNAQTAFSFEQMLRESTECPPEGREWPYELKLDGFRAIGRRSRRRRSALVTQSKGFHPPLSRGSERHRRSTKRHRDRPRDSCTRRTRQAVIQPRLDPFIARIRLSGVDPREPIVPSGLRRNSPR